jgi:hypothetical protein
MKFIQFILAIIVIVLASAKLKRHSRRHHKRGVIIKNHNEICGASDQKCNVGLVCCLDGGDNKKRCKTIC